jgi:hypothetical protein
MEAKKDRIIYNHFTGIKGLSIIELLIGIFLSSVIMIIMVDVLISQDKVFYTQKDIASGQHNMRIAMKKMTKDLMMAGEGRPTWTTINGQSGLDFSVRYADGSLDIVGCLDAPRGRLSGSVSPGSTTITLNTGEGGNFNTTTKSDIRIGDGENAKVIYVSGDTLTIDTEPLLSGDQGLAYSYALNTEVCQVRWVTYSQDATDIDKPVLKMDDHQGAGAQTIVEYITGMSVSISGNMADFTITGRTQNPSKTSGHYIITEASNRIFMRNLK